MDPQQFVNYNSMDDFVNDDSDFECNCIETEGSVSTSMTTSASLSDRFKSESETEASTIDDDESFSSLIKASKEKIMSLSIFDFFAFEVEPLLRIALPMVGLQISSYIFITQTASAVGRILGTEDLAGFSLGNLTLSMSISSIVMGAFSASDTLIPRAYSTGQHEKVSILAVRGAIAATLFVAPTVLLLSPLGIPWLELFYTSSGQDPLAARLASRFVRFYTLCGGIPLIIFVRMITSFLTGQEIVLPLLYGMAAGSFLVHPLLLKWMFFSEGSIAVSEEEQTTVFGLDNSALVLVITQTVQILIVLLILRFKPYRYHLQLTWPGLMNRFGDICTWLLSMKSLLFEALDPKPMIHFLKLSMGGVFSMMEWWFWESVCFLAGTMGVVPLCIHTIPYNLVFLLYMVPLGIGNSLSIRVGNILPYDAKRAKQLTAWTMVCTMAMVSVACFVVYSRRDWIVSMFTSDEEVAAGCEKIWARVCCYLFLDSMYAVNIGIVRALGLQWKQARIIVACLICGAFPAMYYFGVVKNGGIETIWTVLPIAYLVMNSWLVATYTIFVDWDEISRNIDRGE